MVHTVPAAEGAKSSADVEKYSGLKITERQIRVSKWDDLMRGKRYVPFDRLSSIDGEGDAKDAVMIGVVYEKSLRKTGSNGNQYVHWTFTDLSFPQPKVLSLFLYGQAFDTWDKDAETPVANGTIFAVLNPVPLPSRNSDGKDSRAAAKITYGTQLVRLGICPSLGYCMCHKKDGLKCSMACDRDKGPLVCYYHTLQQAAQKTKQWNQQGSGASNHARLGSDGIFVIQQPARPVPSVPQHRDPVKWMKPNAPSVAAAVSLPPPRPLSARAPAAPLMRSRAQAQAAMDASTQRLLSSAKTGQPDATRQRLVSGSALGTATVAKSQGLRDGGDPRQLVQSARTLGEVVGERPLASPARVTSNDAHDSAAATMSRAAASAASKESSIVRRLQAQHPSGIPEPDPNNPLNNRRAPTAVGSACRTNASSLAGAASLSSVEISRPRRAWDRARPGARQPTAAGPSIVMSASGVAASGPAKAAKQSSARGATSERRRAEKEFGSKIAAQLDVKDPRKDLVRQQTSRFQGIVEQERVAKRHRHLADLEAQDAMAEKMEAITEMSVQAWRCQQCAHTTESQKAKIVCEEQGHSVTMVTAKKTRWECKNCSFDVFVLDRELPKECRRCMCAAFRPGPLRRVRTAPLERDGLLARGEELPFMNSVHIPGKPAFSRFKEAADDYKGM